MNTITELNDSLIGRYLVEKEIGQGGMATVYLARDVRHDRKVAIKVLHPELAAVLGPERFVTEMKVTANLQHPHILPLFDSGTARNQLFYVMPFVEGESLRDRLQREQQLPIDDAIQITTEVAGALDYAHRHGVVHRDIKPENILLHDGTALVADFGIALAVSNAGGTRLTQTGLSLGTPQYMSPEQATGDKNIDGRTDIYSLGCVLYEMLAGEAPFTGPNAQAIVAKVLTEKAPPLHARRATVSPSLEAAVMRATQRVPADRFETPAAFATALTQRDVGSMADRGTPVPTRRLLRFVLAPVLLFIALGAFALGRITYRTGAISLQNAEPVHLRIALAPTGLPGSADSALIDSQRFFIGANGRSTHTELALSPDGSRLVVAGSRGHVRALYLRVLSSDSLALIGGTEGAESPFFSPDGSSIAYWAHGRLWRISVAGGPPTAIGTVTRITGGSWGEHDRIVVGSYTHQLILFSAAGSTTPDTLEQRNVRVPHFLPGAETILFTMNGFDDLASHASIMAYSLTTRRTRTILRDGADARYVSTGHLLFGRDGTLLAVPFDRTTLKVSGTPVVVLPSIMQSFNGYSAYDRTGAMQLAISPTGTLAYLPGGTIPDQPSQLFFYDRQGRESPVPVPPQAYYGVRFSPDATHLAVTVRGSHALLDIVDLATFSTSRMPSSSTQDWPLWTPDGSQIAHLGLVDDSMTMVMSAADANRPPSPMHRGTWLTAMAGAWTPDGQELIAVLPVVHGIVAINRQTGTVRSFPSLPADAQFPAFSPDGSLFAYTSADADSVNDVYVQPWPALDRKWKVSSGGAEGPAWTKAGRELLYVGGPAKARTMMSVDVRAGGTPAFSIPHALFPVPFALSYPIRIWDVTQDGQSFVGSRAQPVGATPDELHVVLNWFTELKRQLERQGSAH